MPSLPPRAASLIVAVLLAIHVALVWTTRPAGIVSGRDDAKYLLLSRSVRHLEYNEVWRAGTPPHAQYPPGYPAALAAWATLFGEQFDGMVAMNIGFSLATLVIVFVAVRRRWSPGLGVAGIAALAVNPYFVGRTGNLESEALFTLLSVAVVALLMDEDTTPRQRTLAGALAIAAALTRTAGLPIIGAVGLLWLLQRRWRDVVLFAVATLATVGSWMFWTLRTADRAAGESYVGDAAELARVVEQHTLVGIIANRAARYLSRALPYSMPLPTIEGTALDNVVLLAILMVGLIAGLWVFWKQWRIATLYLLGTGAMLIVWTWVARRFLVPLLPLLVPCFLVGVWAIVSRLRPRLALPMAAAAALLLATTGLVRTTQAVSSMSYCERGSNPPSPTCVAEDPASMLAAALWIRDSLPPGAQVMSAKPEPLYYYSGRQGLALGSLLGLDSTNVVRRTHDMGVDWILLGNLSAQESSRLQPRLASACHGLQLQKFFPPRTYLLRVRQAGEVIDQSACVAMEAYGDSISARRRRLSNAPES